RRQRGAQVSAGAARVRFTGESDAPVGPLSLGAGGTRNVWRSGEDGLKRGGEATPSYGAGSVSIGAGRAGFAGPDELCPPTPGRRRPGGVLEGEACLPLHL